MCGWAEGRKLGNCWKPACLQIHHPSFFVGLILKDTQLPIPNYGHVVLAKPSPILFYPISSKEARWAPCIQVHPGASGGPTVKP